MRPPSFESQHSPTWLLPTTFISLSRDATPILISLGTRLREGTYTDMQVKYSYIENFKKHQRLGCSSMIECLARMLMSLSLIPSTEGKKNTRNNQRPKVVQTYNLSTQEAKTETMEDQD